MTKPKTPKDHFQSEKERRAKKAQPESELMAAARREYEALMAAQATKGKGGRPKKKAKTEPAPDEELPEDDIEE